MTRRPPWYAAVLLTLAGAIASGVSGYYASGAGSSADQVKDNEHRLTQMEDRLDALKDAEGIAFKNVWYAIRTNNRQAPP